jgi:ribosomal protein L40E
MGNYTGPDIPIRIRIQNLVSGQTIAEVGVNRTYSIRLPSSTYIISIENLEGRSSDGYTYYRFMEWRISEDSSTRVSRDPSIRISINRDTVITIILEIYTLQAQPKTTTTQPGTTSANTTTPIAGGTTRSPGDTRPQITTQPRPPLQGGGETGAPEPVIGTQQQPWYSSPVIIGSIAGGATAIAALLVIRRRMLKRPIISDEGPSIRGRGGTGSPSYPSQPQQLPPSPQPSSTTSPMTGGVVAGQGSTHSSSKICPSCGAPNPVSAKFCKQCGTQLPSLPSAEGMMCPYCGASVKRGARFCPRCGSSL